MTRAREIADLAGLVNADSASIAWDTSTLYIDAINNRVGIGTTTPAISLDISSNTDALHIPSGTTEQRPQGSNGMFRYNTTDAQFEGYADGAWGAIAGGGGGSAMETNHFTGNDSATAFTLGSSVSSEDDLIVFIEGIYQNKADYIASGTTLTLDVAPASGRKIVAHHIRAGISGSNLVQNSFSGNGSTTDFTLSLNPVSENNTQVFIDGLYQQKNAYSTSGTTLSFSEAPPNGSTIEVMLFTQTDINTAIIVQDADKDTKIQVEESSDEDIIRFDTAGTERMVIDSTGNLGLGVTPSALWASGGNLQIANGVFTASSDATRVMNNVVFSSALGGAPAYITSSQQATQYLQNAGAHTWYTASSGTAGNAISFTQAMIIDSSGNVGIGTSSPSTALEVNDDAATVSTLTGISSGGVTSVLMKQSRGTIASPTNSATNGDGNYLVSQVYNSGYASIGAIGIITGSAVNNGIIQFQTANSGTVAERMRIDSSGNVGIGTNDPNYKLDVRNGVIAVGSGSNTSQTNTLLQGYGFHIGSTLYGNTSIRSTYENSGNTASLEFYTSSGGSSTTERMRIDSSGHVLPGANNTYDLGSSTKGWRNIYTNDLNLSNMPLEGVDVEGNPYTREGNEVDGTNGSWTIQEGADDLFLINRRNGRKYRFNLTEVTD